MGKYCILRGRWLYFRKVESIKRGYDTRPSCLLLISSSLLSFLATHAPDIRALMDRDGQVTEKWKPRGLSATYLVDKKGIVRYQALGGRTWDEKKYMNFLRKLIKDK